jgi:hypothetical protein
MRPPGLRTLLNSPLTYKEDFKKSKQSKDYLLPNGDVSAAYVDDTMPTNDMVFGMTTLANALSTRTVPTYANCSSPFGRLEHNTKNKNT